MRVQTYFIVFLVALVATAIMHGMAEAYNLYFTMVWFDIPTHFAGGLSVGFAVLWFGHRVHIFLPDKEPWRIGKFTISFSAATFVTVLASIVIIALLWELMEVALWVTIEKEIPNGWLADSSLDFVMGTMGALAAWVTFHAVQLKAWRRAE